MYKYGAASGTLACEMVYSTKSLRPGMVLQEAVRDGRGQVLLPVGVALGPNHIEQLLQRGIPAVSVETAESEQERSQRTEKEMARIRDLFGEEGRTPELEQLRRLVLERIDAC